MPDRNVFFRKARRGRKGRRGGERATARRKIMKCKSRDKKKMDRYTVEVKWWGERVVHGLWLKNPASCHFFICGIFGETSALENCLNEGSVFQVFAIPSSSRLMVLYLSLLRPENLLIGPTAPNLGGGQGWVSTSSREEGEHIKRQHVHRQLQLYVKEINKNEDGMGEILQTWSHRQPCDQLHVSNQFGKKMRLTTAWST